MNQAHKKLDEICLHRSLELGREYEQLRLSCTSPEIGSHNEQQLFRAFIFKQVSKLEMICEQSIQMAYNVTDKSKKIKMTMERRL